MKSPGDVRWALWYLGSRNDAEGSVGGLTRALKFICLLIGHFLSTACGV